MKLFLNKNQAGFTLVEILIVVVIIGILATIAVPTYMRYVERGYASDAKVQMKNILENAEISISNEDLDSESAEKIIKKILEDQEPKPGSYRGRKNSQPENNRTTLLNLNNA